MSDKYGPVNVASAVTLIGAIVTLFVWTFAGKYYPGIIVYALLGMFTGNLWGMIGPVCVEVVGIQLLPSGKLIWPWRSVLLTRQLCPSCG